MGPIEAITSVFRNYINFSGRAGRPEFWWFTLFAVISTALLILVPFLGWIYVLVLLLPSLAVTVRRLHDRDQSGWWAIFSFVPFLNWALLIYLAFPGTPGPNNYGPEPREQKGWTGQGTAQSPQGQPYQGPPPHTGGGSPSSGAGSAFPPTAPTSADQDSSAGSASAVETRRYCTQCGMQLQEGARFCALCGSAA